MSSTEFEFIGGNLSLDFANSFGGLPAESPSQERLRSYADLIRWSQEAKLLSEKQAGQLLKKAESSPSEAEKVLERATNLREAIRAIFLAVYRGQKPEQKLLNLLNSALEQGMAGARISPAGEGFAWEWQSEEGALDQMLGAVARSAAMLLVSSELQWVRKCGNEQCQWLFVDTTKNHRRQWCRTNGCGNVMRVRKHREKQRAKEE